MHLFYNGGSNQIPTLQSDTPHGHRYTHHSPRLLFHRKRPSPVTASWLQGPVMVLRAILSCQLDFIWNKYKSEMASPPV